MSRPALRKSRNKISAQKKVVKTEQERIYELLGQARLLAERTVPSFISGLRSSTVMITDRIPTAAIDKWWRTYWNPRFVDHVIAAAEAVSPQNPCPTCGSEKHHKLSYLTGIWIHEIGHCVFDHETRMNEQMYTDKTKWNIAADIEMNDDIPSIGKLAHEKAFSHWPLPQMCLPSKILVNESEYMLFLMVGSDIFKEITGKTYWDIVQPYDVNGVGNGIVEKPFLVFPDAVPTHDPDKYIQVDAGKIAEYYYTQIPDPPKQGGCSVCGKGEGDEEQKGGEGSSDQQGEGDKQKGQSGSCGGQGTQPCPACAGNGRGFEELSDHGSGTGGDQRHWEDGEPGEGNNAPGINRHEGKAVRRDVAAKIKQEGNRRGNMPAGWLVWADAELQPPKVRWQDKLSAAARQAINRIRGDRYTTFRRLSRTSIVSNFQVIKPSTFEVAPTVLILLDTSGSMGIGRRSRLERGLSECEAILKLHKVKAYFMDGDANIYGGPQELRSMWQAKVNGGGGTDMSHCVQMALKEKIKPDLMVLLTDGDTPWPSPNVIKNVRMITGIVHEKGINGCPPYMNPIWIDTDDA